MPEVEEVVIEGKAPVSRADADDAFVDHMVEKYEGVDEDAIDEGDTDSKKKGDVEDSDAEGDEQPEEDTPADDPDGDTAESTDDSDDDTDDEDSADNADSDDDATGGKAEDERDDDEVDAEDETGTDGEDVEKTLAAAGADTKLADVPEKYRPLVERKLKSIDAAFTRVQQERTAFRKERAALIAEERFRTEHSELYFVEQMQKDPELMARVNAALDTLDGDSDGIKAEHTKKFQADVEVRRKAAAAATEQEYSDALEQTRQRAERGLEVHERAQRLAVNAGVPFRSVENAILRHLAEKKAAGETVDITDAQVAEIVKVESVEHKRSIRGATRQSSQESVRMRSEGRRSSSPAARVPGSAVSPRPSPQKKVVVDQSNEEDRIAAMMRTARRVMPGVR